MNELVSVIIPTFNKEKELKDTMESIINQSYTNWECIVVDDGSTDNTISVIEKYQKKDQRIYLYHRPLNRANGGNAARNYGFEVCKGQFIQWFDADDIMHIDKLKQKVEILNKRNCDFVVCEGEEFEINTENVVRKWNTIFSDNLLTDHIYGKVNFHTNGPMFKRDFLNNKLLFDEKLKRKQEWEFFSRLLLNNPKIIPIHKALYYFRSHENSINGRNTVSSFESIIKANVKVFAACKKSLAYPDYNFRKYFIVKYVRYLKFGILNTNIKLVFMAFLSIIKTLSLSFLVEGIKRIIKNPKILKNLVNVK